DGSYTYCVSEDISFGYSGDLMGINKSKLLIGSCANLKSGESYLAKISKSKSCRRNKREKERKRDERC
ncbi:MAG: hypothetical protein Q8754_03070, partial [Sweet potato little leaf phytoplasma]|nr:hypothetical protein [Sweet potato little leaf phytoplasma]